MRVLDLFCGQGGAGEGYRRAGFDVVGVDIEPQPRNPHTFIQAAALKYARDHGHEFDVIHASPPCQDWSITKSQHDAHGTGWLLPATRDLLDEIGKPYVIENVPGAQMRRDVELCGLMFGLRTYRHRWFEISGFFCLLPPHTPHLIPTSTKQRKANHALGFFTTVTGNVGSWVGPEVMGIDWMTGEGLSQAIPPAYTQFIGEQLMAHLQGEAA